MPANQPSQLGKSKLLPAALEFLRGSGCTLSDVLRLTSEEQLEIGQWFVSHGTTVAMMQMGIEVLLHLFEKTSDLSIRTNVITVLCITHTASRLVHFDPTEYVDDTGNIAHSKQIHFGNKKHAPLSDTCTPDKVWGACVQSFADHGNLVSEWDRMCAFSDVHRGLRIAHSQARWYMADCNEGVIGASIDLYPILFGIYCDGDDDIRDTIERALPMNRASWFKITSAAHNSLHIPDDLLCIQQDLQRRREAIGANEGSAKAEIASLEEVEACLKERCDIARNVLQPVCEASGLDMDYLLQEVREVGRTSVVEEANFFCKALDNASHLDVFAREKGWMIEGAPIGLAHILSLGAGTMLILGRWDKSDLERLATKEFFATDKWKKKKWRKKGGVWIPDKWDVAWNTQQSSDGDRGVEFTATADHNGAFDGEPPVVAMGGVCLPHALDKDCGAVLNRLKPLESIGVVFNVHGAPGSSPPLSNIVNDNFPSLEQGALKPGTTVLLASCSSGASAIRTNKSEPASSTVEAVSQALLSKHVPGVYVVGFDRPVAVGTPIIGRNMRADSKTIGTIALPSDRYLVVYRDGRPRLPLKCISGVR